jgi:hypothetical protein
MKNGNQPAFAMCMHDNTSGATLIEHGLTKREYFAALAMQGLLASDNLFYTDRPKIFSSLAVKYADALLAELEAEQEVSND